MKVGLASVMSDEMDRDDPPSNLVGSMLSLFSSDKGSTGNLLCLNWLKNVLEFLISLKMSMIVEKSVGVVSSQVSKELNVFIKVLSWDKGTGGNSFRELVVGLCLNSNCFEKVKVFLLNNGSCLNILPIRPINIFLLDSFKSQKLFFLKQMAVLLDVLSAEDGYSILPFSLRLTQVESR